MKKKHEKDVKELADFVELSSASQKRVMKRVISSAVRMQKLTIRRAGL